MFARLVSRPAVQASTMVQPNVLSKRGNILSTNEEKEEKQLGVREGTNRFCNGGNGGKSNIILTPQKRL